MPVYTHKHTDTRILNQTVCFCVNFFLIQYGASLLPSVNVIAQRLFSDAKYTHIYNNHKKLKN